MNHGGIYTKIFVSYIIVCLFPENSLKRLVYNPLIVTFRFFFVTETRHFNVLSLLFVVKFYFNASELSEPNARTLNE